LGINVQLKFAGIDLDEMLIGIWNKTTLQAS
jgi:hypothetical protein